jgi:hypothetical protein
MPSGFSQDTSAAMRSLSALHRLAAGILLRLAQELLVSGPAAGALYTTGQHALRGALALVFVV